MNQPLARHPGRAPLPEALKTPATTAAEIATQSIDDLARLAEVDIDLFKLKLHNLLKGNLSSQGPRFPGQNPYASIQPKLIAAMLQAAGRPLKELGIEIETADSIEGRKQLRNEEKTPWVCLTTCLSLAEPQDALVIFGAMADALKGQPMEDGALVMKAALGAPRWGHQAIETFPAFFLSTKVRKGTSFSEPACQAANALQVLATIEDAKASSYDDTLQFIRALQRIGVRDVPDPVFKATCLHAAALHAPTQSLKAFLESFPDLLEAHDCSWSRPLHYAAASVHETNVGLLLSAGAEPRPVSEHGETPLNWDFYCTLAAALTLISTGAYTSEDVDEICDAHNSFDKKDVAARLRACHAAVVVRKSVDELSSTNSPSIKPL